MGKLRKEIKKRIAELEKESKTNICSNPDLGVNGDDYDWQIGEGKVLRELKAILEKADK